MRRRLCLFPSNPCRPQNCTVNDPLTDRRKTDLEPDAGGDIKLTRTDAARDAGEA
jgi:hypothetical protein